MARTPVVRHTNTTLLSVRKVHPAIPASGPVAGIHQRRHKSRSRAASYRHLDERPASAQASPTDVYTRQHEGPTAGNSRPAGAPYAGRRRVDARVLGRRACRASLRRRAAHRGGLALSGTAPDGGSGMAAIDVGTLREQSAGAVL